MEEKEIKIEEAEIKYFLDTKVLPVLGLNKVTENNIDDVFDYIVQYYETAYVETDDPRLEFIDKVTKYLEQFMDFVE